MTTPPSKTSSRADIMKWSQLPHANKQAQLFAKAKKLATKLPFVRHVVAFWYAFIDRETPLRAKSILILAIAYFVVPFDLIPDFLAGIGYTDDAAVIFAALRAVRHFIKPEHYARADAALAGHDEARPA